MVLLVFSFTSIIICIALWYQKSPWKHSWNS